MTKLIQGAGPSRRDFLKTSTAAVAAAGMGGGLSSFIASPA
ncbi:twin-arginine translocation signal domain-containing protein, partial [Actibacterium sp.]